MHTIKSTFKHFLHSIFFKMQVSKVAVVHYPLSVALYLIFPIAFCYKDANLPAVLQGALNAFSSIKKNFFF